MKRFYAMVSHAGGIAVFSVRSTRLVLFASAVCLAVSAAAHGFDDLARTATVIAPVPPDANYGPSNVNDGIASGLPYYWTTSAGFDSNTMAVELGWTSPQLFDTVMVHLYNHPIAYQYYNGGNYGTPRVYHLQQETSPGVWQDIATAGAVSDPDDITPFVQFNLPGGVSLDKVRVQDIFDMHEIAVWNRTGNIASSATVTAQYNHATPGYDPSRCVDNDFSTMYFAGLDNDLNRDNTGWMQFDWDGLQRVDSVRAYFFPHPELIEGKVVSLQQETSPGVWETIATATVGREDSGYYQTADFNLSSNNTFSRLRIENVFDVFEVDIKGSSVPEPSTLAMLTMSQTVLPPPSVFYAAPDAQRHARPARHALRICGRRPRRDVPCRKTNQDLRERGFPP
jgi:hypothetical protein